jgi:hypothetical protein
VYFKTKELKKVLKNVFSIIPYKRTSRLDIIFSPLLSSLHSFTIRHAQREYKLRLYVEAYELNFCVHINHERLTPHMAVEFEFTLQHNC